jgi:hypothetical protein
MALQDAGLNAFNDFCRAVAFVYSDAIFENSGPSRCPACASRAVRMALGPRRRQCAFLGKSAFNCQQAVTHDRLQRRCPSLSRSETVRGEDAWPLCIASVLFCTLAVWPRMAAKMFSFSHQSEALVNAFQITGCSGLGILIFFDGLVLLPWRWMTYYISNLLS